MHIIDVTADERKNGFIGAGIAGVAMFLILKWLYWLTCIPIGIQYISTWMATVALISVIAFGFGIGSMSDDLLVGSFFTLIAGAVVIIVVAFVNSSAFTSQSRFIYANSLVEVKDGSGEDAFQEYIQEGKEKNLPVIGQEEAQIKGDTLLGSETGLTSRFALDKEWTSQEIGNELVYVNELEPRSIFRWDKTEGNFGYITVNRSTGQTEYINDSLFYTVDAPFSHNALRVMRKAYPGVGITEISPEIDEEGHFYYVASTFSVQGVSGLKKVTGVIVLDAKTGATQWYSVADAPEWIDRVYPESFFTDYVKYYGRYKNGFMNSIFAKKDVIVQTNGMDVVYDVASGDCYYYTGYAGEGQTNSSAGIAMMNSRTGKITFYKVGTQGGISEQRAQTAAEGKVADFGYKASYPLLLSIGGEKSMFMLMRSEDGTLMGYSFVSYTDASKVAFGTTLVEARAQYLNVLANTTSAADLTNAVYEEANGTISQIAQEVSADMGSYYVVRLVGSKTIYIVTPDMAPSISFAQPGDKLSIKYLPSEGDVITAVEVTHTEMTH